MLAIFVGFILAWLAAPGLFPFFSGLFGGPAA